MDLITPFVILASVLDASNRTKPKPTEAELRRELKELKEENILHGRVVRLGNSMRSANIMGASYGANIGSLVWDIAKATELQRKISQIEKKLNESDEPDESDESDESDY